MPKIVTPTPNKPDASSGKLVEYLDAHGKPRSAIIVTLMDEETGNCALRDLATLEIVFVDHSPDPKPLTWH